MIISPTNFYPGRIIWLDCPTGFRGFLEAEGGISWFHAADQLRLLCINVVLGQHISMTFPFLP